MGPTVGLRSGVFLRAVGLSLLIACSRSATPSAPATVDAAPAPVAAPAPAKSDVALTIVRERDEPADEAHGKILPVQETQLRVELAGAAPVETKLPCLHPQPVDVPKHVPVAFVGLVSCYASGVTDFLGIVEKSAGTYAVVTWQEEEGGPDEVRSARPLASMSELALVRARAGLHGPVTVTPAR